jgi:hypothetical protein
VLADQLAKEAAVEDGPVVYDKIPREVIIMWEKENGLNMWQQQWTNMGKGAVTKGAVTKVFFLSVRNRLWHKITIFPEFVTTIRGHGKLRSYLRRFGLIDNPMCPCEEEEEEETTDHWIFQCNKLHNQRNEMIKQITNTCGTWPAMNETLVNDYLQLFVKFIKSIDLEICNDM